MNACKDNNLSQYVDFPTHKKNNVLDLILSNNDFIVGVDNLEGLYLIAIM